jgi:PhzF family phenazine biosynthesis protein
MTITDHRFTQLDVFTDKPLRGNPLAVVHDAQDIDDATMAAFARWTNLSETAFLLPPTDPAADYRVRIFTPGRELPFAGHPTLGACHAWLQAGGKPRQAGEVVQQCGIGLVRVRSADGRLAFAAPPLQRSGPLDDTTLAQVVISLRIDASAIVTHQWVSNGPHWLAVMLHSADEVLALKPDFIAMGELKVGVIGPQPAGHDSAFEVRAFAPILGVPEDPVTGSLNAGIAQWLIGAGLAPSRYVAAQGTALGRSGRVFVERLDADIWIGGHVAGCIEGRVTL